MLRKVNRRSKTTLTAQVVEQLTKLAVKLGQGEAFPSERDIAGQTNAARNVVRTALRKLEADKVIKSNKAKKIRVVC